jgi:hypothetical protein
VLGIMKKLFPVLALGAGAALIFAGAKKRPRPRGLPEEKPADEIRNEDVQREIGMPGEAARRQLQVLRGST